MKNSTKAGRIIDIIFSSLLAFYCFFKSAEKMIGEKNLSHFGYKIYSQNSDIEEAKVFLIGNVRGKHQKEISSVLSCYADRDDVVLVDGIGKEISIERFLEKGMLPHLEAIKNRNIRIIGAEDMEKVIISNSYWDIVKVIEKRNDKESVMIKKYFLEKICELEKGRDKNFAEELKKYSKHHERVYLLVGCSHIESNRIINILKKETLKYIALLPKAYKSVENAKAMLNGYFERKRI